MLTIFLWLVAINIVWIVIAMIVQMSKDVKETKATHTTSRKPRPESPRRSAVSERVCGAPGSAVVGANHRHHSDRVALLVVLTLIVLVLVLIARLMISTSN